MHRPTNPYALQAAQIDWEDGIPVARQFGDVYFSRDDGVAESRHVFLHHNHLPPRWQALRSAPTTEGAATFTIVETGFGTGLNFLLAWQLWQRIAPPGWRLHYISFEKHPLTLPDLQKAHQSWPQLATLADILQHNYPPLIPGQHRRQMNCEQVCLELIFAPAEEGLAALMAASSARADGAEGGFVDAWFLDGFAPAKNPDMWQLAVLEQIGRLSRADATFATFTAVGAVRRGLQAQGFEVEKVAGFGRKREMLRGRQQRPAPPIARANITPWHQPRSPIRAKQACVIGAGLAGSSTARALAQRGYRVQVIERHPHPAQGASGNPQGVIYTKLSPAPGSLNRFTLASFLHALGYYRPLLDAGCIEGDLCGVIQLASGADDQRLLDQLQTLLPDQDWVKFVDARQASALAGIPLSAPALHFPLAGWLDPAQLCRYWLDHPGIELRCNSEALTLCPRAGGDPGWQVMGAADQMLADCDIVVVANSNDARQFAQCKVLPLRAIRGQLSYLDGAALNPPLQQVVCHEGYVAPAHNGQLCLGASFDLHNQHCELLEQDHRWNLAQLESISPGCLSPDTRVRGGRAALRCASPDYHPIVGPMPDVARFETDYQSLRHDAKKVIDVVGSYVAGLYVNLAHGSRGLTSSPLCAELLVSYIAGEFSPLDRNLCEALSPGRFLIRDLKKRRR